MTKDPSQRSILRTLKAQVSPKGHPVNTDSIRPLEKIEVDNLSHSGTPQARRPENRLIDPLNSHPDVPRWWVILPGPVAHRTRLRTKCHDSNGLSRLRDRPLARRRRGEVDVGRDGWPTRLLLSLPVRNDDRDARNVSHGHGPPGDVDILHRDTVRRVSLGVPDGRVGVVVRTHPERDPARRGEGPAPPVATVQQAPLVETRDVAVRVAVPEPGT